MRKGQYTRKQAVNIVGEDAIISVERENCEPTNRVGYNGICQDDDFIEWSASVTLDDGRIVTAYYYTDSETEQICSENDEWIGDVVDWDGCLYAYDITEVE